MSGQIPLEIQVTRTGSGLLAHGSAVALDGRGILMVGPSGSGKSMMALALMAHGAALIADDRVAIGPGLLMSPPEQIAGRIEARFIGILGAETATAPLELVLNMGHTETERLPPRRVAHLDGQKVVCLHAVESPYFPAMILQYLSGKRYE